MTSLTALACSLDALMTMPGTRTSVEMCDDESSRSGSGLSPLCSSTWMAGTSLSSVAPRYSCVAAFDAALSNYARALSG